MKIFSAFLIASVVAFSTVCFSQHHTEKLPSGKWYGYNGQQRMTEYEFHPNSIIFRRLLYTGQPDTVLPNSKETPIMKTVFKHGNIYEVLDRGYTADSIRAIIVNILKPSKNPNELIVSINPGEREFTTLDSALDFINTDTEPKFGWALFSEAKLNEYKKMRPVERITIAHLAAYLDSVIAIKPLFDELKDNPYILGLTAYSQFKLREFIRQLGYSPLHEASRLDELVRLNQENPAIAPRITKLKGGKKPQ